MRTKIIQYATAEIGIRENPENSNKTKYGKWFGLDGQPWCGQFVSWVFAQAGYKLPVIDFYNGFASCNYAVNNVAKWGKVVDRFNVQPGDVVFFDWQKDGHYDHTGIYLEHVGGDLFQTIEGNTSLGNDSNGGIVLKR